jgi:hypothetical protein
MLIGFFKIRVHSADYVCSTLSTEMNSISREASLYSFFLRRILGSSRHPLNQKNLRNTEIAFGSNVWNCLCTSLYSGSAKNLRDPSFGEKVENFGDLGWFGEQI